MTSKRRSAPQSRRDQPAGSPADGPVRRHTWQLVLTAAGTAADLTAIFLLFVTGYAALGVTVILLTVWFLAFLVIRDRIPSGPAILVVAVLVLTLILGGALGYLWGPAFAPTASRDADLQGYCAALGADGFSIQNRNTPRSPEGRFFCRGLTEPISMEAACRWKWGPQKRPPTLADESDAFTWRCHPRYR